MKIEEAINILKQYIYDNTDIPDFYTMAEACEVVIKALDQQSCGDCISREEMWNAYHKMIDSGNTVDVYDAIKNLPSVTPQPCEDCISRQELLKAISTWDKFGCDADTKLVPYNNNHVAYIHYDDVINCIKGMPPVTPQPKPNIKALGEDIRICQKSITDKKVLIGFNMAVALCNKHLAESEEKG